MSWFRSTPQSPTRDPSQTESGEYKPLDRNERQACWAARDAYFACLDRNDILNPLKDGAKATSKCGKESEAFDRDCAASWVSCAQTGELERKHIGKQDEKRPRPYTALHSMT